MTNDVFICPIEIKNELKEIEDEGTRLVLKLSLLSQKIKYIFSQIKFCTSIEFANDYFDLLDSIQSVLCRLFFNQELGIPDRLRRFVKDFDNIEQDKKYYFEKIQNGEYSF